MSKPSQILAAALEIPGEGSEEVGPLSLLIARPHPSESGGQRRDCGTPHLIYP